MVRCGLPAVAAHYAVDLRIATSEPRPQEAICPGFSLMACRSENGPLPDGRGSVGDVSRRTTKLAPSPDDLAATGP
jgi:hypothetical protein